MSTNNKTVRNQFRLASLLLAVALLACGKQEAPEADSSPEDASAARAAVATCSSTLSGTVSASGTTFKIGTKAVVDETQNGVLPFFVGLSSKAVGCSGVPFKVRSISPATTKTLTGVVKEAGGSFTIQQTPLIDLTPTQRLPLLSGINSKVTGRLHAGRFLVTALVPASLGQSLTGLIFRSGDTYTIRSNDGGETPLIDATTSTLASLAGKYSKVTGTTVSSGFWVSSGAPAACDVQLSGEIAYHGSYTIGSTPLIDSRAQLSPLFDGIDSIVTGCPAPNGFKVEAVVTKNPGLTVHRLADYNPPSYYGYKRPRKTCEFLFDRPTQVEVAGVRRQALSVTLSLRGTVSGGNSTQIENETFEGLNVFMLTILKDGKTKLYSCDDQVWGQQENTTLFFPLDQVVCRNQLGVLDFNSTKPIGSYYQCF